MENEEVKVTEEVLEEARTAVEVAPEEEPEIVEEPAEEADPNAIRAEVNIGRKDLQAYMFYAIYHSFSGLLSILLGLGVIGGGIFYLANGVTSTGVVFLCMALLFFVLQPAMILFQSNAQSKNPVFQATTFYEFSERGLKAWQEGVKPARKDWTGIMKVVENGNYYYVFFDKVRANVIPKASFVGENALGKFDELMRTVLPKEKRKGFKK